MPQEFHYPVFQYQPGELPMWANYYLLLQIFHREEGSTHLSVIYQDRAINHLIAIGEFRYAS